ncbi:B-box zinc finger family protein, related [Eimeria tenella]|uniref:B-box zinc finger family protein, related n=1 Tax=Eimeria tenella TaxID=5802 RepID=U6KY97_EIMTE|nr:B-box zinc finger family protein, related [Eimeria tenella]CDJ41324.1 B-box zinc finger family protein, related [Eimeria tenella]|eukprot:XP_013232074.1 B-box zinc finger family protein, related [Eimeria tenella]
MAAQEAGFGRISDDQIAAVIRYSDEWAFIEYMLQISTRTSRVKLLQAWHLSPPQVVNQFERRTARRLVVYSFVEASLLDEENTIQNVTRRGFKIDSRAELTTSAKEQQKDERSAFIEAAKSQLLSGERRVYEFFLCKVGVGHSVVMKDEREASGERTTLPQEYDSAYLENGNTAPTETLTVFFDDPDQYLTKGSSSVRRREAIQQVKKGLSMATAGVLPQHTMRQEYVVYDSSQVLPVYLVLFEVDSTEPELFAVPLCEACQDFPASIWCPADTAKLCEACDGRLHSHNKLVSRHIRVPLNEMPKPSGRCKQHTEEAYESFCTMCHAPVCRLCRPNHIHADVTGGSAANDFEGD